MTDFVTEHEGTEHESPELRLLGDITEQFRHLPVDRAATQVAAHIRQFWDPRMRAELARLLTPPTGDDLIDAVAIKLAQQWNSRTTKADDEDFGRDDVFARRFVIARCGHRFVCIHGTQPLKS